VLALVIMAKALSMKFWGSEDDALGAGCTWYGECEDRFFVERGKRFLCLELDGVYNEYLLLSRVMEAGCALR